MRMITFQVNTNHVYFRSSSSDTNRSLLTSQSCFVTKLFVFPRRPLYSNGKQDLYEVALSFLFSKFDQSIIRNSTVCYRTSSPAQSRIASSSPLPRLAPSVPDTSSHRCAWSLQSVACTPLHPPHHAAATPHTSSRGLAKSRNGRLALHHHHGTSERARL